MGPECPLFLHLPNLTHVQLAGASALLLLSSLPRVAKGPVPAVLVATSASAALYYGRTIRNLRG